MNYAKSSLMLSVLLVAYFVWAIGTASAQSGSSEYMIWNTGTTYRVNIKYEIRLDSEEKGGTFAIRPKKTSEGGNFYGEYQVPYISFKPVVEFYTDNVISEGKNYYGMRRYKASNIRVDGVKDIRWKSDKSWYSPWRWAAAWRRSRNSDMKKWQEEVKKELSAIKEGGGVIEYNPIFADKEHKVIPFDINEKCLFLCWNESSIKDYLDGKTTSIEVWEDFQKVNGIGMTTRNFLERRKVSPPTKVSDEIRDSIRSECNATLFAVLGKKQNEKIEYGKVREIEAKSLNGLLATKSLQDMFLFEGVLEVVCCKLKSADCKAKGFNPFLGVKLKVRDSRKAKVAFDAGHGYKKHDLTFELDSPKNCAELWFDTANQTIRYAHVRMEIPNYEGNIPVPTYAKMLSTLSGEAKGRVTVECEYKTFIEETLCTLPEENEERL